MTESDFKRLSPLTPLVRGSIVFVAAAAGSWQSLTGEGIGVIALVLMGLLVAGVAFGAVSWWRTKYWIEGDELRVDTGVISRQSRRIRIDRLQGIDIVQPFVARLFGLAELRMDVAGGGKAEGSLAFMSLVEAQDLKELLLARRDAAKRPITHETPLDQLPPPHPDRLLAKLELRILLASWALSPETIVLALAVMSFGGVAVIGGSFGAATGILPVVIGFGLVAFRKFAGFYNFTITDTAAGLQVRRGLLELTSQTVALNRVQGVVVAQPLLWRPFGWARLDVSIAGASSADAEGKLLSSTLLPVGPLAVVLQLAQHTLRGIDLNAVPLSPPPSRTKWVEPIGRFFVDAGLDERMVVCKRGWFTHKTHAVPHRRVQSVRVTQGPLMRRLRLAHVYVDSPPGPVSVTMRFRDETEARRLLERAVELGRQARKGSAIPTADTTQ
ncbi:MAG TPA: PH domain-containing protein [Nocardioidaceae bacterium]|nr:PH domain-containing protein [Nocardioidaceae bacterium]